MESKFTRPTTNHFLPMVQKILAMLEVEVVRYPDLDKKNEIMVMHQETDPADQSQITYSLMLMATWLEGTPFEIRSHGYFAKKNAKAKWAQLVQILYAKLLEFHNGAPLIVLGLSRSGRIARQVVDQVVFHEFEKDGFKPAILRLLVGQEDYVQSKEIKKHVVSRSKESVSKTIGSVNSILCTTLQLPKNQKVIDSKRGQGYRINPFYNLVLTD